MAEGQKKVYLEILEQIRSIIHEDRLVPGDKLPSERELAERLNAGRSSVREALRALELLGLIETRRGEGTFIKDSGQHRLVEILGTFILENDQAKEDLIETKYMVILAALQTACERMTEQQKTAFQHVLDVSKGRQLFQEEVDTIHQLIIDAAHNRLLAKIWSIIMDYSSIFHTIPSGDHLVYEALFEAIKSGQVSEAQAILRRGLF